MCRGRRGLSGCTERLVRVFSLNLRSPSGSAAISQEWSSAVSPQALPAQLDQQRRRRRSRKRGEEHAGDGLHVRFRW